MKDNRQSAILDIIRNHPVTTQDELLARLRERGLRATQATISRDIKQLRLVKSMNQDGAYCYTVAHTHAAPVSSKFERLFADAVLHVEAACNMVVCKCIGGMAQAACAAVDARAWDGLVGTIAGEDTFVCIMKMPQQADELAAALQQMLR